MNTIIEQLKKRLSQLGKDIHPIEQILSANGHPQEFVDYLLDQYHNINRKKEEIREKIRNLEEK